MLLGTRIRKYDIGEDELLRELGFSPLLTA